MKFYNPQIDAVAPEKLENKKGLPIPLQSALKVLRDKKGGVRLKIPNTGDASDPKFSFSDAINQALIKGLTLSTVSYLKYMLALAERRTDQIEAMMVSQHGIEDKRIFICKPQIDENADGDRRGQHR